MKIFDHRKLVLKLALLISAGGALFGARTASAETAYHMICRSGGSTIEVIIDGGAGVGFQLANKQQTRYTGSSTDIRHHLAPGQCSWSTRPIVSGDYGWGPITGYSSPAPFYTYPSNGPDAFDIGLSMARLQASGNLDIVVNVYVYQRTLNGKHYLVVRNTTRENF